MIIEPWMITAAVAVVAVIAVVSFGLGAIYGMFALSDRINKIRGGK